MSKVYTAYNAVVQKYIMDNKGSTSTVKERMELLSRSVEEQCGVFNKLFPGKQAKVLNEIIYAVSGCGVWKIGAATLARKADCSERTVYAAVSALKKTGEFIVARLADGHAGHYVFVDKRSERFEDIMYEVFGLPASEIAGLVTGLVAGLENAETVDTTSVEGEKQGSNYINYFKSFKTSSSTNKYLVKLSKTNGARVCDSTENMSKLQKSLYDTVKTLVDKSKLKELASAVLSMTIDNANDFVKAKNALIHTLTDIADGTLTIKRSLRAVVSGAYKKSTERSSTVEGSEKGYEIHNWLEDDNFITPTYTDGIYDWLNT